MGTYSKRLNTEESQEYPFPSWPGSSGITQCLPSTDGPLSLGPSHAMYPLTFLESKPTLSTALDFQDSGNEGKSTAELEHKRTGGRGHNPGGGLELGALV